jgi:energy-converting hydrogenase Eha subunit A
MKEFLTDLGINITLIIAGFLGSIAVQMSKKSKFDWRTSLLSIALGMLTANYVTPIVVEIFGFGPAMQNSVAFLLGYFGLKGMEKLCDRYIKKRIGD